MPRSWPSMESFEAFLDGGGIVEVDDDMPDRYRRAVFSFIEMHANSELMGGLTERDWIPKTPGLRHKMAVLAKTQDEIGHGHLLYMIAADMGIKTRVEMLEDLFAGRGRFHNVFHYRAETWGDQVAIAFLVDAAALASQQAVFKNCSYGPYKRILKRIISEEGFHMRLGEDRMMRIAEGTERQRRMFQDALDRWFWPSLQLFGPDSQPDDELLRWHIKSERNEVLRDRWVQKFVPLLLSYGFTIPAPDLRYDETNAAGTSARSTGSHSSAHSGRVDPTRRAASGRRPRTGGAPRGCGGRSPIRCLDERPSLTRSPAGKIHEAISAVDDPEYPGLSIVDLGLLETIRVRSGGVTSRARSDVLRLPRAGGDRRGGSRRGRPASTESTTSTSSGCGRRRGPPTASPAAPDGFSPTASPSRCSSASSLRGVRAVAKRPLPDPPSGRAAAGRSTHAVAAGNRSRC